MGLHFLPPLQALLLVERLCADWDRAAIKKPWNARDAIHLHALCGAFLHHLDLLKAFLSGGDFEKEAKSLRSQFLMAFLDADLESALTATVPPGSLTSLACMRPAWKHNMPCGDLIKHLASNHMFRPERILRAYLFYRA